MKTSTLAKSACSVGLRRSFTTALLVLFALGASVQFAFSGSATWSSDPATNDWNTANNWIPNTVPNGSTDIATFDLSNTTNVTISVATTVQSAAFNAGASEYEITVSPGNSLTFIGGGISNSSGITQNFVADASSQSSSTITFTNGAIAGDMTLFTARGSPTVSSNAGVIQFLGTASAGNGSFVNEGAPPNSGIGNARTTFSGSATAASGTFLNKSGSGLTEFINTATAGSGTFTNEGATDVGNGGLIEFNNTSTAGSGTFLINGSSSTTGNFTAEVTFTDSTTADNASFTINGGTVSGASGGLVSFLEGSNAGESMFVVNGATVDGASGGQLTFGGTNSTAANATVIINGGQSGGGGALCFIGYDPGSGGTPRIEIFGNGLLEVSTLRETGIPVGSIEGDGSILLTHRAHLIVGGNDLSTTFSGVIQDLGTLQEGVVEKNGTGTLTLAGANTYLGGTTIISGALIVANTTGSGTGTGAVTAMGGTLGGEGIISGAVTVGTGSGTGAFLAPAFGSNKQVTLTLQSSLTLQVDATYTYTFKARRNQARTDLVIANGVTINGATINLQGTTQGRLRRGTVLTVISNTAATPISGTFSNLADGAIVTINGNNLQANYEGGDGNDLTLTVVP